MSKINKVFIAQAIEALTILGIPFEQLTVKRTEKMALVFLAVCQVRNGKSWTEAEDISDGIALKTRGIIDYLNKFFEQDISSGSYDDIRRKDLKFLVLGNIVVRSNPNAARNDAARGYALNKEYKKVVQFIGTKGWQRKMVKFASTRTPVSKLLAQSRDIKTVPVRLSTGEKLNFSPGEHNLLQKAIIEELLPRYGYGAEVLYVGDTADKFLYLDEKKLKELRFFELAHGELPDVVAYSKEKNWIYLIEAVHSSGPISATRLIELQKLTNECTAAIVYVTAFLNRDTLRKFIKDIAWETEVWIAANPDHMIHLNGDKFMGPYTKPQE